MLVRRFFSEVSWFLDFWEWKEPNPSKVEAMLRIHRPDSSKQLLSWMQTANFYRRFICKFSKTAAPLHAMLWCPQFSWISECQQAFEKHCTALTSTPILGHFYPTVLATAATDASATALSALLAQKQNRRETAIVYVSRALTEPERMLHSYV